MKRPLLKWESWQTGKISLFWKHMFMMVCILVLCLIVLSAIQALSLNTLTEENMEKLQINLDRDCESLADTLDAARYIPNAVEDSKYYKYISNENAGYLPQKRYPILHLLRESLMNQLYLQGGSEFCVLYHSGSASVISTNRSDPVAEHYFSQHMVFSETGVQTILAHLKESGSTHILPVQTVQAERETQPQRRMAVILHPTDSKLAVMSIYSEGYILECLGQSHMPEGTHLEVRDSSEQIVLQYPAAITDAVQADSRMIHSELDRFGITVTVWVPNDYFSAVLLPVRLIGAAAITAVALIGLALALLFSRASVVPIRRLIDAHGEQDADQPANEIVHLDQLLSGAQQKTEQVRELLLRQVLSRAMSGAILSESEERLLQQGVPCLNGSYHVAILHTTETVNGVVGEYLAGVMDGAVWTLINDKETGLVFGGGEEQLTLLQEQVGRMLEELEEGRVLCGVSASAEEYACFHKAVQQARLALPQKSGVKLFVGEKIDSYAISWLQHQRLYQSIHSCNEEDAVRLLSSIAQQTDSATAHEAYYNICFVLRSAAEELGVPMPGVFAGLEYKHNRLPQENVMSLRNVLKELFAGIREKNERRGDGRNVEMQTYIQQHFQEYDICAAMVAEQFGISERLVYDLIRKQTGMSFNEYVTSLRMNLAAGLLYTTNLDIKEIGQRCGYRILNTFYRVFKAQYGMSPGQYRDTGKQARNDD